MGGGGDGLAGTVVGKNCAFVEYLKLCHFIFLFSLSLEVCQKPLALSSIHSYLQTPRPLYNISIL